MYIQARFLLYFLLLAAAPACKTVYRTQAVQYQDYRITPSLQTDSSVHVFLKPYGDSVNKSMNMVLGHAALTLEKTQPEGSLGNFVADAFLYMAREKYQTRVDLAFVNFGGIRLTQLPAGPVTRGKVFELMPFDNLLILQKVKGSVLQQFLDLTAARGGWPMAGLNMQMKGGKAVRVMIGGQLLDPDREYTIANSDFIANGGDNADMLRPVPQTSNGYLMRDAIIDYILLLEKQGKKITAEKENRVSHAE